MSTTSNARLISTLNSQVTSKCAVLFRAAGRIGALLSAANHKSATAREGCLDDLLGAVYSLIFAVANGYVDRPTALDKSSIDSVITRANDLASGHVRTDGKWIAGFYFNNALFRLAAIYHRELKVVAGKEKARDFVEALLPEARSRFKAAKGCDWANIQITKIHTEVNGLKHTASGLYSGRTVTLKESIDAVEELLALFEAIP